MEVWMEVEVVEMEMEMVGNGEVGVESRPVHLALS
jgi:hypothetical protein